MLFNSVEFLIFFPLVTVLYFVLPHRCRTSFLLAASCLFYMAFVPAYILILAFTIVVDYAAGIWIESAQGSHRKLLLVASIVTNVGALCIFKYVNFLIGNVNWLGDLLGIPYAISPLDILLPIGLSFHTFQAMSYTIEVYRGNQAAERSLLTFALYVMFYPQLVAGPIERPQNLLPQFREHHRFDYSNAVHGLQRMAVGMFKKVVIADNLSLLVNQVYQDPEQYRGLPLILATVFFAFQIYYDFSGYSDIALGSAQVMGFRLMENFRTPYFSKSIGEFWRRWHISLSTWFKDYVYVPLGGNRGTRTRHYLNLVAVFVISGLWHGANWTYVIWGLLHGMFLITGDATKQVRSRAAHAIGLQRLPALSSALSMVSTFALVTFAWVFFRATSLSDALYVIGHMPQGLLADIAALLAGHTVQGLSPRMIAFSGSLLLLAVAVEWLVAHGDQISEVQWLGRQPLLVRYGLYLVLIYGPLVLGSAAVNQQFIYFQF
jgi:D-alanyl-lipoteichoic acid acyltransferase DltB (MBOAT superfamily)